MFLDWFKSKKPTLKLKSNQEVEIEFFADDTYKTYFTTVLDARRNDAVLKTPGTERRPVRMESGQRLTVTTLADNKLFYFDTEVTDAGEREFDIATPTDVKSEDVPNFENNCSIEAPVNVECRAIKLAHSQSAQTHSISLNGMVLACNIAIPEGTDLHIEIQIPGTPVFSFKGRALKARPNPDPKSSRKYLCEVEYIDDASQSERLAIMRYAVYLKRREERRLAREGQATK